MLRRNLRLPLLDALRDTPVVFLSGARQTGKSTLVRDIASAEHRASYFTFDDLSVLGAAQRDPEGFVAGLAGNVVLDEVQRAPEVLLPIKASVDRDRRPGRFLLTGSANVLALPTVSQALVGRMETLTLWPLSQGELEGRRERFVDALFDDEIPIEVDAIDRDDLARRITLGGYPEVVGRDRPDRRDAWFRSYLTTILQRDVRDLASIEGLAQLPQLLGLIATRLGSRLNVSDVSRTTGVPQTTLKRYLDLLGALHLVSAVSAWTSNRDARLVKSPKLYLTDSGLAVHLTGASVDALTSDGQRLGPLLETFVINELRRQLGWALTRARLYHFQTYGGREVDAIIEDDRGRCVAVEVKATASLGRRHLHGIEAFAEIAGNAFHRGVILYTGKTVVPYGDRIHALPIGALWRL